MAVRCACIDVGANTTRLLVADVDPGRAPREVAGERALVPLHPGPDGVLGDAVAATLRAVVVAQLLEATRLGADRVRVVATAALRHAADRDEVLARVGVPVDVLSGDEEAELAFTGATAGLELGGSVAVLDVGGASTEVAVGTCAGGCTWTRSLPVGSGRLALAHLHADPPGPGELDALQRAAAEALAGLGAPGCRTVLAVGGPGSSLRRVCGEVLDEAALRRALEELTAAPVLEVAARTGVRPDRVRLLPGALALLGAAGRALGGTPRLVPGGLREGVCVRLAR
jgi:exopolyphosphatase/guanosine-5'-triphosphate,3'-diphosphate pyrophosphatase